jgi:hypothetical protein
MAFAEVVADYRLRPGPARVRGSRTKAGSAERALLATKREAGEGPLADRIGRTAPRACVLIGLGIESNVRRAVRQAGREGLPFYALPFPNWPRDVGRFHDGLVEALVELREHGAIQDGD